MNEFQIKLKNKNNSSIKMLLFGDSFYQPNYRVPNGVDIDITEKETGKEIKYRHLLLSILTKNFVAKVVVEKLFDFYFERLDLSTEIKGKFYSIQGGIHHGLYHFVEDIPNKQSIDFRKEYIIFSQDLFCNINLGANEEVLISIVPQKNIHIGIERPINNIDLSEMIQSPFDIRSRM